MELLKIWVIWILQVPQILICINIVLIKSTKDIIQGISKLDKLQKVSRLQINKSVTTDDGVSFNHSKSECETFLNQNVATQLDTPKLNQNKKREEKRGSIVSTSTFSLNNKPEMAAEDESNNNYNIHIDISNSDYSN